jgi:hypothetical protein
LTVYPPSTSPHTPDRCDDRQQDSHPGQPLPFRMDDDAPISSIVVCSTVLKVETAA